VSCRDRASLKTATGEPLRKHPYLVGGFGSSMLIEIGRVEAIFRYPVKSMAKNDSMMPTWAVGLDGVLAREESPVIRQ
jgi:hypothetical protein